MSEANQTGRASVRKADRTGGGDADKDLSRRLEALEERLALLDSEAASLKRTAADVVEAARREAAGLPDKARRLADQNAELSRKADALTARNAELSAQADELARRLHAIEEEKEALGNALREAQGEAERAKRSVAKIRSSLSWRITAPLRGKWPF